MKRDSFEQASRLNLKFQESENTLYIPKLWHRVQTMDEIETDMKMPTSPPIVEGNDQGVMTQVTCIKPIEPSSDE